MPEHTSWLSFVPGYDALEQAIAGFGPSWLAGHPVLAQHIASILLVSLVMLTMAIVARSQLKKARGDILPERTLTTRTFVEILLERTIGVMEFAMPHEAALRHFWLLGTLGLFILFSNLLGMIPGFLPPTENYNVTFACASIVFVYYNGYALYKLGLGHLAHMANPVGERWGWFLAPLMFPVELISHCIRPVSLSVRLFCNIGGDHMVLSAFVALASMVLWGFPALIPLPLLVLGLFVALVQTFIFLLLSSVYIGEVEAMIAHHQEHERHAHSAEIARGHSLAEAIHDGHSASVG